MVAIGNERSNGVVTALPVDTEEVNADTTLKLALTKVENPYSGGRALQDIVTRSSLVRELGGLANTLFKNEAIYAERILGWTLNDIDKAGIKADPNLVRAARRIVQSERR